MTDAELVVSSDRRTQQQHVRITHVVETIVFEVNPQVQAEGTIHMTTATPASSSPAAAAPKKVVAKKATAKAPAKKAAKKVPAAAATAGPTVPPIVPPVIPPNTNGGTGGGGGGQPPASAGGVTPPLTPSEQRQQNARQFVRWGLYCFLALLALVILYYLVTWAWSFMPTYKETVAPRAESTQTYPDDRPTVRMSLPALKRERESKIHEAEGLRMMHNPPQATIDRLYKEADALYLQILQIEGGPMERTATSYSGHGGFHAVIDAPQDGHVALTYEGTEAYKARLQAETCQAQIQADANRPVIVPYGSRRLGAYRY